ncbi:hypothetical protein ACE01N_20355 [Saccharicrinis sp. FJH2]|uniref:hypothetical protein n=1 Tax=Saccharicrinis sp. FJH65 TaxID=3344659 RepID=UPI0035F4C434
MKKAIHLIIVLFASLIFVSCDSESEFQTNYDEQNIFLNNAIVENYGCIDYELQYKDFQDYSKSIIELKPYFDNLKKIFIQKDTYDKETLINSVDSIKSFIYSDYYIRHDTTYPNFLLSRILNFINHWTKPEKINTSLNTIYLNQVLMLEKQITDSYIKNNYNWTPALDKYKIEIIPDKEQIKLGDEFSARVFFTGFPTKYKPRIIVSELINGKKFNSDTIDYNFENTKFTIMPDSKGIKELNIEYIQMFNGLNNLYFSENLKYEVK